MHGGQLDVAVINIQLNYVVVWLCFLEKRKICMVIKRNAETEFLSSLPASGLMRWRGGGQVLNGHQITVGAFHTLQSIFSHTTSAIYMKHFQPTQRGVKQCSQQATAHQTVQL